MMTARLPYRPSPYPHEGVNGFLLRLAEGNGCSGVRTLVGDIPVTRSRLATWLGRDDGLGQLVGQLNAKKTTPRPLWNNRSSRYCPACLRADQTWRQEWELTLLTVCPSHGCRLVEVCSDCGRQITWNRMRLLSCDCGFRFQAACVIKATEAETALAATLCLKLVGRGRVSALVDLLNLEQLYQLIVALGAYSHVEDGKRPQKIANLGHLQVSEKLTRAAAEILVTWPTGFNALLNKLAHDQPAPSREVGLPRQFGFFYAYVFNWMNAPEFGFVLSAFEKYIAKHWPHPLNERNKRMSPELRSTSVWIPASVAAKELGTTRRRLLSLADAGMVNLSGRKTVSGRKVLCVERSDLPAIRLLLADLMDHKTACAILNISKVRMHQLLHHSVLRADVVPGKWAAGKWGISMKPLQTILLAGFGLPAVEGIGKATITMDYALRHLLKREYLFPLLIQAAIKKEMAPIAVLPEVPGVAGWVFSRDHLVHWIGDRIQGKRQGVLTIPEAAVRLGIKQQALYHFVSKKLIRVDYDPDALASLIPEQELVRFQEEYVLGREIGERLGTSASQAVRMLQKQDAALAICGRTIDGGSQYLYRRDDRLDEGLLKLEQKVGTRAPTSNRAART